MISQLINYKALFMSNPTTFIEMQQDYPFNAPINKLECDVQVKQVIEFDLQPRFILKEKIRMLKSLGFQNLVGLQSSKSDESATILYFQYVGGQITSQLKNLSEDQLTKISKGMLELSQILASKWIVHNFQVKRIGLDKRYSLKYFLGVDFKVDKNINKQQIQQNYETIINQMFARIQLSKQENKIKIQNLPSPKGQLSPKIINIINSIELGQRKILKKSSILQEQKEESSTNTLKASSRFTFNNDNHITVPPKDKAEDEQIKSDQKPLKIQQLNTRINRLKDYMKQITKKVAPNRNTNQMRTDQSTQKPLEKRRSNPRQKKYQAKTTKVETVELGERSRKNPINLEDNRQHKQYIMLANKDKYCEQFMLFLQDNLEGSKAQQQSKKGAYRQNLKTQSSQMTLQIQNRVQKAIRSSLRLINGLKSRQSIRCQ